MQFGSLQNMMIGSPIEVDLMALPDVGSKCTKILWTDRKSCTVVKVEPKPKRSVVWIREDDCQALNDVSSRDTGQKWECVPSDDVNRDDKVTFKYGNWQTEGGTVVRFGFGENYRDPIF